MTANPITPTMADLARACAHIEAQCEEQRRKREANPQADLWDQEATRWDADALACDQATPAAIFHTSNPVGDAPRPSLRARVVCPYIETQPSGIQLANRDCHDEDAVFLTRGQLSALLRWLEAIGWRTSEGGPEESITETLGNALDLLSGAEQVAAVP